MTTARTRTSVRLVQDGLLAWFEALVAQAASAEPAKVRLHPLRVSTAGRSGDNQGLSLISPTDAGRDAPTGVPAAWLDLARPLAGALERVFPRPDARPGSSSRPRPAPPVDALPAPLSAWYRARMAESDDWTWVYDGPALARAPSLTWRAPVQVRMAWLLSLDGAGDDVLPVLGAVCAEMVYENSFLVQLPPSPVDPLLVSYASALGESAEVDLAGPLDRLVGPESVQVSVSPSTDLTIAQVAQLTASMGRPGVPALQIATGLLVGGLASFGPAAVPAFAGRPRRDAE